MNTVTEQSGHLTSKRYPPRYDRSRLKSRIVHLGFGAFHRAHQALLTDQLAAQSDSDWGICEVNLLGGEALIEALREQDHRYSVLEKGADSSNLKIIDSICESLHLTFDGIGAIIAKMAEPQVAIVSLTITEKGYCLDPSSGHLDKNNPLISADLATVHQPKSALGVIVEALDVRRQQQLPPFSVLSCDNIQGNGHLVEKAVLELAEIRSPELASWIKENVSFPCTMVDRIVPAATEATLAEVAGLLGVNDPCAIACEPFIQWVVEDNFVAGRPQWQDVGAQLVDDVIPYEEMKLRMLNGSHSFLAYLGYLAGYQTIDETVADPCFFSAARSLMLNEQALTLHMPSGTDLPAYAQLLLQRYRNPNLKHRTWQIAMDGSQKLPQRFLKPLSVLLEQQRSYTHIALGIAGWMRYVSAIDEQGQPIDVRDPMAEQLHAICQRTPEGDARVAALLAVEAIFPPDLIHKPGVAETITQSYQQLLSLGARAAVAQLAS